MKEFVLQGSHFEIGQQYGRYCRKRIWLFSNATQLMVALSERPGADLFNPQFRYLPRELARFFKNRRRYRHLAHEYHDVVNTYYPEGLEVLRGMADGARIDFDDLLFLNVAADFARTCTTIAAAGNETATGEPVLGMNADETRGTERAEIVLDIRPNSGYRHKVCALAGFLCHNFGMNETGLTQIGELLFVKKVSTSPPAAPMLLHFSILERCATVDEAKDLLDTLPPCGPGSALYVADSEKFLRMETNSLAGAVEVVEDGIRWNANEPQTDVLAPFSAIDDLTEPTSLFSKARTRRLTALSGELSGKLHLDTMQAMLADHGNAEDGTHMHSMCMHPNQAAGKQTCASIVALPRRKTARFFEPNPCRNVYTEHVFRSGDVDGASMSSPAEFPRP